MANQKLVAIDDAKLQTLSVEIKTLSIGRKQMTLAVFRQLPTAPLFDLSDAQLRYSGIVWGRVNYHWTNCCPDGLAEWHPHVHIVWQRGSMLAQSPVYLPVPNAANLARSVGPHDYTQTLVRIDASREAFVTGRELWRFINATRHPLYAQRYAEAEALDQLFIAV